MKSLRKQVEKLKELLKKSLDHGTSGVIRLSNYDLEALNALKQEVGDRITIDYDSAKDRIRFKINPDLNNRPKVNQDPGILLIPKTLSLVEWINCANANDAGDEQTENTAPKKEVQETFIEPKQEIERKHWSQRTRN